MRFLKIIEQISTVFTTCISSVFIAQFTQTSNNTYTPPTLLPFKTQTHTYSKFKHKNIIMGGTSVLYRTFGVYHFISLYFVAEVVFIILQVYFCSIYHFAQND